MVDGEDRQPPEPSDHTQSESGLLGLQVAEIDTQEIVRSKSD